MARYYVAHEIDLGFYPNHSLAVGDINGDGRKELAAITTDGNTLRVFQLNGSVLFERTLHNLGNWGTAPLVFLDTNHDRRQELIVPNGPPGNARIIAINAENEIICQVRLENHTGDDYGIAIPLLGTFRRDINGHIGISAAVAGGQIVALDAKLNILWTYNGLRHDFGHRFYNCDVDNDGVEEIVFNTVDRINHFGPDINGDLVILRADGRLFFRKPVRDIFDDTHFDDVAIADFRGIGHKEILVEKGILLDWSGQVIWDLSSTLDHGQWIAKMPNPHGPGLLIFISELWGLEGKSKMIHPSGHVLWELGKDKFTKLHPERYAGYQILPTRPHAIDWFHDGHYEIALGEQLEGPTGHACYEDISHDLKLFFFDPDGHLLHELHFTDTRRCGFWYTGEVRSYVTDMDHDGYPELVFPRQDGKVMIIKKER